MPLLLLNVPRNAQKRKLAVSRLKVPMKPMREQPVSQHALLLLTAKPKALLMMDLGGLSHAVVPLKMT